MQLLFPLSVKVGVHCVHDLIKPLRFNLKSPLSGQGHLIMETLTNTKKITLATLKSFAKRNEGKIYAKTINEFDGMTDCVEDSKNAKWREAKITEKKGYFRTGIQGIYTVGSSRDYFTLYKDGEYAGIEVNNCCGASILAVKIPETFSGSKRVAGYGNFPSGVPAQF